jgi:hypothetical protein
VISFHHRDHDVVQQTLIPCRSIGTGLASQPAKDGRWIRRHAPFSLCRKDAVVHPPELALGGSAQTSFGRGARVGVQMVEREVRVGEPHFPGRDVVAHDFGSVCVVPILARWALEIAGHYQPDCRAGAALDPCGVSDGDAWIDSSGGGVAGRYRRRVAFPHIASTASGQAERQTDRN